MQFLAEFIDWKGKTFEITGNEARHIAKVLRKKPGDVLRLFDGKGTIVWGQLTEAAEEKVSGKLLDQAPENARSSQKSPFKLHLLQSIPKGERWEWALQKGCEVGIASFIPVISERTVVKISKEDAPKKVDRWQKILESASKQCGMAEVPKISKPLYFAEALQMASQDLRLFCWESELSEPLPKVLQEKISKSAKETQIFLLIGPEGGWSAKEAEEAQKAGWIAVGLGPQVLRAETAPVVAAAMIQAHFLRVE